MDNSVSSFSSFQSLDHFYNYGVRLFKQRFTSGNSSRDFSQSGLVMREVIGRGAFGIVAVAIRGPKEVFAVKIFDKASLKKKNMIEKTIYEKRLFGSLFHPNIVNFVASFKDNSYLYLVMQMVHGGDMYTHLKTKKHFSEAESKFIAAQVVLAFEYLHRLKVIHRDLKMENLMVESRGYIKLTDFGFAKLLDGKAFTSCGTPDYMAPEIFLHKGYMLSGDWWALGVLIFELNTGFTPFYAQDASSIFRKAARGKFMMPERFSKPLKTIITALLRMDPTERLGCNKEGTKAVMGHEFFQKMMWWQLFEQKLELPFVPQLKGDELDLSNFLVSPLQLTKATQDRDAALFAEF